MFGRRFLSGAMALAAMLAPVAGHAASDQALLTVNGSVSARCRFVDVPPATDLGNLRTAGTTNLGTLSFSCNVPSGTPQVSVSSSNGGLKRNGGPESIGYRWTWAVPGVSGLSNVSASSGVAGLTLASGAAHLVRGGTFSVTPAAISSSASVAGDYADVITITVTP
jgi:hypothetical protein